MKRFILLILLMLPIVGMTQAHLGVTEQEIRDMYPDKEFKVGYADEERYITAFMHYGFFFYYFDNDTKLCYLAMQVIYEPISVNGQVEVYNGKYVIISKNKWHAYLDGGGELIINLTYSSSVEAYLFSYTSGR